MSLSPGTRIGPYEVTTKLGEGGMGEVYRARDTKLSRDVALKILPAAFATDPDRLARFKREALVLASLNHPNIASVYGFEDAEATHALVMELVEGDDLSTVIQRGALPVGEAIPIARQIADALEAAHESGVIHRDLKPGNIKVRQDGTVKVLDFGLAKAMSPENSGASTDAMNSPTMTARATQLGMILGTAAYMAPEQAKGKPVDKRADIWAFGVVLYEMLTGRRAFEGEDVSTTLAAVLMKEPEWTALPADTPPALKTLIARCLERDPKARLRDIGEARLLLSDPERLREKPSLEPSPVQARPGPPSLTWIAIGLAAGIALAVLGWQLVGKGRTCCSRSRYCGAIPADAAAGYGTRWRLGRIAECVSRWPHGGHQRTEDRRRGAIVAARARLDQHQAASRHRGCRTALLVPRWREHRLLRG